MANYKKLGEKIKQLRRGRKLTQEQLAEMAKVDPKSIIEIENGKRNPTYKTLNKLAAALKIHLSEIL
jgi:transcriptional regulator with XRE-family HTH domain